MFVMNSFSLPSWSRRQPICLASRELLINAALCFSPRPPCPQVAEWDKGLRETQDELLSLADDVQKLVLGQQVIIGRGSGVTANPFRYVSGRIV